MGSGRTETPGGGSSSVYAMTEPAGSFQMRALEGAGDATAVGRRTEEKITKPTASVTSPDTQKANCARF
jgi:hypothetical protein